MINEYFATLHFENKIENNIFWSNCELSNEHIFMLFGYIKKLHGRSSLFTKT